MLRGLFKRNDPLAAGYMRLRDAISLRARRDQCYNRYVLPFQLRSTLASREIRRDTRIAPRENIERERRGGGRIMIEKSRQCDLSCFLSHSRSR